MKNKKVVAILSILILASGLGLAENEPEVAIQKSEGRIEAVVSSQAATKQKPQKRFRDQVISAPGDIIVWVVRAASASTGTVADGSIKVVQTVGGFLLAPVFRTLDMQGKIRKSREPKS